MKLKWTKYHLCEEQLFERNLSYKLQDEGSPPTSREGGEGGGDENVETPNSLEDEGNYFFLRTKILRPKALPFRLKSRAFKVCFCVGLGEVQLEMCYHIEVLLGLKSVVCPSVVQIMTQTADNQTETFQVTHILIHTSSLMKKR